MKTLKKTLCLVLALVMAFSLMSVASAASNMDGYTDADKVGATYETAVEVLMGLGIVNGMSATEIAPEGNYTRAQAAKIATYLAVGPAIAEMLPASEAFVDVPATHWAAKYIAYCAEKGILNGVSATEYAPEAYVTGYQFAKMVLAAMGYGKNNEFVGNGWAIATAQWALDSKIDLFKNDSAAATNEPITRQQAMLIAFNALYLGQPTYSKDSGNYTVADDAKTFADTYKLAAAAEATDVYGLPTTEYKADGKVIATIVTDPVLTSTDALTLKELTTALGKNATIAGLTAENSIGGNGTMTYVYATATKDTYTYKTVETLVAVLAKEDVVAAKDDAKAYIQLGELKYETEAYKEGDVVLYTVGTNDKDEEIVVTAAKATANTGSVTAVASDKTYIRIDGEQYVLAANVAGEIAISEGVLKYVKDASIVFYTDSYGYIVYACAPQDAPKDETEVATEYYYVINMQATTKAGAESDLFGDATAATASAKATVLNLETGKVEVIDLAIVADKNGDLCYADKDGKAGEKVVATDGIEEIEVIAAVAKIDAGYVLVGAADLTENVTVKQGVAEVAGMAATSKTVLTVVEYTVDEKTGAITGAEVTTTTGIANFAKDGVTYASAVITASKEGIISEILVLKEKVVEPVKTPAAYAIFAGEGEIVAGEQTYALNINGEIKYYVADAEYEMPEIAEKAVVTFVLTDGKISKIEAANKLAAGAISLIDDTYIVVANELVYFAEATTTVNADDSFKADTIAVKDEITVYGEKDAEFIVIDNK